MKYPRTLVISNNSFSLTNSNGRTLGNFFIGWPKESLAQFCISSDGPNYDICNNYYCITDKEALKAFMHFKAAKGTSLKEIYKLQKSKPISIKSKKNAFRALIRHFIWTCGRKHKSFRKWIDEFNPEVILLQNTDSAFVLDIAKRVTLERHIPIIMFNTEGFYFFKHNFMEKGYADWLYYPLFRYIYRQHFKETMKHVAFIIHGNELLKEDYDNEFNIKSTVLFTGSTLSFNITDFNQLKIIFSYIGNFGYNRPKALAEIADVLQSIDNSYYLDVYGNPPTKEIKDLLCNHPGIHFKGILNYDEVKSVIYHSDVLFHAESQDVYWKESLKYGFSTKIADSISSGKFFIIYSSPDIACARYILKNGAGLFADNKRDLQLKIKKLLTDKNIRNNLSVKAKQISAENHNIDENRKKFQAIISNIG